MLKNTNSKGQKKKLCAISKKMFRQKNKHKVVEDKILQVKF